MFDLGMALYAKQRMAFGQIQRSCLCVGYAGDVQHDNHCVIVKIYLSYGDYFYVCPFIFIVYRT